MNGPRLACVFLVVAPSFALAGDLEQGVAALGKKDFEQAIGYFNAHILENPRDANGYYQRGTAYRQKWDSDRAIWDYTMTIRLDPRMAVAFHDRGMAYANKRDYARAVADYTESIRLNPRVAGVFNNRGLAYAGLKDHARAIADFSEAVRLDPRMASAFNNRGIVYADGKEYGKAALDYARAIELDPRHTMALNNFAWLLATCPHEEMLNGKKAVEYAMRACELSGWKVPSRLTTLAAAHAECGDFEEAVQWQNRALRLGFADRNEAEKARERMRLYESGKPCREK